MTSFRSALLILLISVILEITALSFTWASASVPLVAGTVAPVHLIAVTGREIYPLANALGWASLVMVVVILATRGWVRITGGALLMVSGGVLAWECVIFGLRPDSVLASALPGAAGETSIWWLPGLVGGLGLIMVAVLTISQGRRWPGLSARYERQGGTALATTSLATTSLGIWDALDRGEDPTT